MSVQSTQSANRSKASTGKPDKPYPDFPLFPHATGRWAKKIRGKLHYFGKWAERKDGKLVRVKGDGWQEALDLYQEQRDDLHAGRKPRKTGDGLTLRDLCNRFLTSKQNQVETGELSPRTFTDYKSTTDRIIGVVGKTRLVDDIASDDFELLRKDISKTRGVVSLGNEITRCRVVFNFAFQNHLIEKPVRYGSSFKKPSKRVLRKSRQGNGPRMFEAAEIHTMLDAAGVQLRTMVLLGLNCGFGNNDCGTLPISAVDLESGWIDFPRPKTGVGRRCPLWQETVEALRESLEKRPTPKDDADADLVFITKYGGRWAKETADSPVTKEFRKLVGGIDDETEDKSLPKLYRKGRGFYALRHTFETIGGESRDQVAVNALMGHVDESMAAAYRERISDERLRAVVEHVRQWLFGDADEKASENDARRSLRIVG